LLRVAGVVGAEIGDLLAKLREALREIIHALIIHSRGLRKGDRDGCAGPSRPSFEQSCLGAVSD
jgi:hypothetical protein